MQGTVRCTGRTVPPPSWMVHQHKLPEGPTSSSTVFTSDTVALPRVLVLLVVLCLLLCDVSGSVYWVAVSFKAIRRPVSRMSE